MPDPLADFTRRNVTLVGESRDVYVIGTGPAVIVMAEVPGITPKVADFARKVAAVGCSAWLPVLFGTPGAEAKALPALGVIARACISKEWTTWARGEASPITVWLRALARLAHGECGGPGVGAVGMCITGNFALAMMVDDIMLAPVLSQPSLPFAVTRKQKADVAISAADMARVKQRVADGACLLGLRFTGDPMAPAARFDTLTRELGEGFIRVEIDSSKGNAGGNPTAAHSVLTEHLVDEPGHETRQALDLVLEHFRSRLLV